MSASSSATPENGRFDLAAFYGESTCALEPPDLERQVERLTDPASARETLHWGRNYLYTAALSTHQGTVEAVVKQFRNQGWLARLRRRARGSKAERNWRTALRLLAAGVDTPRPLLWIESRDLEGPSFYVAQRVSGYFELRALFRALQAGERERRFPHVEPAELFAALGRYLRSVHDAGVWHRDISIGNVLVRYEGTRLDGFQIVDLNRARLDERLGAWRRSRDLSRLPVVWPELRQAFLGAYWGSPVAPLGVRALLYRFHTRAFLLKHWFKNHVRTPIRSLFGGLKPRRAHVHIPEAPSGVSSRDKVVWDRLSDQPHQHASSIEKSTLRFADLRHHARAAWLGLPAVPRIWRRYRQLHRDRYRRPTEWAGVGVALRPWTDDPAAQLELLDGLGVRHALVRLHPWQERHDDELALARELHARGYELAFSLPQNRELVRNRALWRRAVETLAELFLPYGSSFQIGQAINRSKWGVWTYQEYLDLAATAAEVLRAAGEVTLLGPAVIDFEFHATGGVLNLPHDGIRFDAAAHLLYVDRRGAPENTQLGFDAVDKLTLVHAIAATSRNCEPRSWITEFNWPLREGPHSPAGRDVSVDEETQASYLVRYYLLTIGTGLAERVYWWQLISRGYGLVSPGDGVVLRPRPAYAALKTMVARLAGSRFIRPLVGEGPARLYLYERDGVDIVVGWSVRDAVRASLPRPAAAATDRDGRALPPPPGTDVELSPAPVYFELEG